MVAATYDRGEPSVTLTFDRAVDLAGFDPSSLNVFDGPEAFELGGTGAITILAPDSAKIILIHNFDFTGPGVTMTATGGAGIVAQDGGAAWAGVTGLELPFP